MQCTIIFSSSVKLFSTTKVQNTRQNVHVLKSIPYTFGEMSTSLNSGLKSSITTCASCMSSLSPMRSVTNPFSKNLTTKQRQCFSVQPFVSQHVNISRRTFIHSYHHFLICVLSQVHHRFPAFFSLLCHGLGYLVLEDRQRVLRDHFLMRYFQNLEIYELLFNSDQL